MISASSSTLRAARKLAVEPIACLEHGWTRAASPSRQPQRSYNTERPTFGKPRRRPQPVPTATQPNPRTNRFSPNPKVKASPSSGDSEEPKRLLEPYVLSKRLTDMAERGQLDEAVHLLQNSPLDASNVPTWNTLLLQCVMQKRFKLGHKLFTDMKRRGFQPNTRTYDLLLDGLSRIDNWEEHGVQFKNAQALWQAFLRRIEDLRKIHPEHREISSNPAAFYITILAANNDFNALFDVLYNLDDEGPFSPNEFVYYKAFKAIAHRTQLAPGDKELVGYRNASDTKLVWKDLMKREAKGRKLVSGFVLTYVIKGLMRGRPADQLYAFDIIHDHLGLSKPGEEAPQRQVGVDPTTLSQVLQLCLHTQKYRLCIHYVQQIIDDALANNRQPVINYGHMDKVLRSYAAMTIGGSAGESDRAVETIEWMHKYHALGWDVQPRSTTYSWGLMSCWRGGDWASAARITELMTGCHAEDFVDGSKTSSSPRLDHRTQGRMTPPDAKDMSCLLRAALASEDVANMRQCLRMATFFGGLRTSNDTKYMDVYLSQDHLYRDTPRRAISKQEPFYSAKVASTLADVLTRVLEGTDPAADTLEMKAWRGLRARVKRILRGTARPKVEAPDSELDLLGSAGHLKAVDRFVEQDLLTRAQINPGRPARR